MHADVALADLSTCGTSLIGAEYSLWVHWHSPGLGLGENQIVPKVPLLSMYIPTTVKWGPTVNIDTTSRLINVCHEYEQRQSSFSLITTQFHDNLFQQSIGLLLQYFDVVPDLRQRAQGLGHVGQHLAAEEALLKLAIQLGLDSLMQCSCRGRRRYWLVSVPWRFLRCLVLWSVLSSGASQRNGKLVGLVALEDLAL